jgi:hypothetical protein
MALRKLPRAGVRDKSRDPEYDISDGVYHSIFRKNADILLWSRRAFAVSYDTYKPFFLSLLSDGKKPPAQDRRP